MLWQSTVQSKEFGKSLDFFKFLDDVSSIIWEASSILRRIGGVSQILSPIGSVPDRVVDQLLINAKSHEPRFENGI